MEKYVNNKIKNLVIEILLIVLFLVISVPFWDYMNNESLAAIAKHYNELETSGSKLVISNQKQNIYAETFEESIKEMNYLLITSYNSIKSNYDIYIKIQDEANYDNIYYSDGSNISKLSDFWEFEKDSFNYFKLESKSINYKETIKYNYYIWTKRISEDNKIKLEFTIL